ncbi:MAG: thiamine-phosphate kinase [Planctomycetota bacterium]|nr:thiamine-phosphate kinase [Planctomycetota bacterium]
MSEDLWLADALAGLRDAPGALLGPGDDAAVLAGDQGDIVLATDVLIDGVHFVLAECGARAAARKALAVNLSDLAAMGAEPRAFVVGLVLPAPAERALFDGLMAGFRAAGVTYGCALVGGDTNVAAGPLTLAVTVVGRPSTAAVVTRSGARPGDVLSVTGPLGGSRRGRHLTFEPRLAAGVVLARAGVHAMMDLSDGLARDLPRLCRSSGVGAVLDAELVPVHSDANGVLERALNDGEDFELLVAHGPLPTEVHAALQAANATLIAIGQVRAEAGVWLRDGPRERPLPPGGYDHLAG